MKNISKLRVSFEDRKKCKRERDGKRERGGENETEERAREREREREREKEKERVTYKHNVTETIVQKSACGNNVTMTRCCRLTTFPGNQITAAEPLMQADKLAGHHIVLSA